MITFLIFASIIFLILFLEFFNESFLIKKALKSNIILINDAMVKRLHIINKQRKKSKFNSIFYSIPNYVYREKDLRNFNILFISFAFLISLYFQDVVSIKISIIFLGALYITNDTIHHIVYRNKRIQVDLLLLFLRTPLKLEKMCKFKEYNFIGTLFFSNNLILIEIKDKGKTFDSYKWTEIDNIEKIKCTYFEKSITSIFKMKDETYEKKFPKFIFESDQVEKDYFEALYEFPFMERSKVYDFEKLHHDIMQDLVDEERTFCFKDYLIKEEDS